MIIGFIILVVVLGIIGLGIALGTVIMPDATFEEKRRSYELEKILDLYLVGLLVIITTGVLIIRYTYI